MASLHPPDNSEVTGQVPARARAWVEDGSSRPLRAEIRVSHDTTLGFQRQLTLSDADDVEGMVRTWLQAVLAGSE
jgi:hypothetical protein